MIPCHLAWLFPKLLLSSWDRGGKRLYRTTVSVSLTLSRDVSLVVVVLVSVAPLGRVEEPMSGSFILA